MHTTLGRWLIALTVAALAGCQGTPPSPPPAPAPVAKATPAPAPAPTPASAPVALGEKLAGLPAVTVAQLVDNPAAYAGKKIRVEGTIASYCFHKKDWYAIRDSAAPGPSVRILTGEGFRVPDKSQGRRVRTEGTVEVVDVTADNARHYAGDHGLGDPKAFKGPQAVKQVTIRAAGAEFI